MSGVAEAIRVWRLPWVRWAVAAIAFGVVTVVSYRVAHARMDLGFAFYDDEGYMLTALKGFVNHGHLYDQIFSQYGPFYYEAWGGFFSLFGIPVDHDSGRTVVTFVWVLASLAFGLTTMRLSASLLLGIATQMLVFRVLLVLANEPMHPGGIISLLLAAIVVAACFVRDRSSPYAMAALGAAVAALILVKINVGFFALASLALACVLSYSALQRRRWLRPAVEAGFVVLPLLLMLEKLGESWARDYGLHVAIAALAVVIVLRVGSRDRRPDEELRWLLGGLVVVAVLVCLTIVAAGTSPGGLFDGVIRQPLHQGDAFTIPLRLASGFYLPDLLALGGAIAFALVSRRRRSPLAGLPLAVVSLFCIVVGVTMALSVTGEAFFSEPGRMLGYPLSMLGFCWVALIAMPGSEDPALSFGRLLVPLLAVLQSLHAYPVAGSQIGWSALLLVPVGALCVANGARGVGRALTTPSSRWVAAGLGLAAAAALLFSVAEDNLRKPLDLYRATYAATPSLGLPGAEAVHLNEWEIQPYGEITAAIRRDCPAFLTLPGMDSFYLWTGQEPPTGLNATAWMTLFDEEQQRRVIDETRSIDGLCLLENRPLIEFWTLGPVPPGPLVHYLHHGFQPLASFGEYRLLQRQGEASEH